MIMGQRILRHPHKNRFLDYRCTSLTIVHVNKCKSIVTQINKLLLCEHDMYTNKKTSSYRKTIGYMRNAIRSSKTL